MQIIYGYSNCSDKKYNEIISEKNVAVLQPDQKYHGLLIKGLAKNGARLLCLSGLPINRTVTSKLWICEKDEQEENIYYHYYKTLNLPFIRQLMIFLGAFVNVLKIKQTRETYAICDCLNIANAFGIALACRTKKIPVITVVTDLPNMQHKKGVLQAVNNKLFGLMSGFIFLTEQMNDKVNLAKKPYIVLEGHVDANAPSMKTCQKWEEETGKKVVLYAGSILKLYGIANLVEGFLKANLPETELWIFGNGDYKEELMEIAETHTSVKYMGIRQNQEVVACEMKAALLINPRPVGPEYTKYSFPSKNMEYMVSGTPLATTKLPGMPVEYEKYVYLLENETAEGIANRLEEIFNISMEERNEKGVNARKFVLHQKSNVVQGKKIIDFMRRCVK